MTTKEVVVSGAVGKQVYPVNGSSGKPSLKGLLLCALSGRARVVIRDGNASGEVRAQGSVGTSGGTLPVILTEQGIRFDKGMHVKVLGTGATCYLYID
jgi:hypothetical protein